MRVLDLIGYVLDLIGYVLILLTMVFFWVDLSRSETPFQKLSMTTGTLVDIGECTKQGRSQTFHVKAGGELRSFHLIGCIDGLGDAVGDVVQVRADPYSILSDVKTSVSDLRTSDRIYLDYNNPEKHSPNSNAIKLIFMLIFGVIIGWALLNIYRSFKD